VEQRFDLPRLPWPGSMRPRFEPSRGLQEHDPAGRDSSPEPGDQRWGLLFWLPDEEGGGPTPPLGASREQRRMNGKSSRCTSWREKLRRIHTRSAGQHLNLNNRPSPKPLASRHFLSQLRLPPQAQRQHFCSWWRCGLLDEPEPHVGDYPLRLKCRPDLSAAESPVIPSPEGNHLLNDRKRPATELFE